MKFTVDLFCNMAEYYEGIRDNTNCKLCNSKLINPKKDKAISIKKKSFENTDFQEELFTFTYECRLCHHKYQFQFEIKERYPYPRFVDAEIIKNMEEMEETR